MEEVDTALGLANVEVSDDGRYILVDKLTPRAFAETADMDLEQVRLLYQFYALKHEQYSAFMKNLDEYRISIIDLVDFIYEQKESGGLDFDQELSEEIDDLHQAVCDAREQLEGEHYDRLVFTMKGPVEGAEVFAAVDRIRDMAHEYYKEVYVVGDATSNYDLSSSFQTDNVMISVLTALFVGIILLFTFQSAGLPVLLVLTIQGSIWINFSVPVLTDTNLFFLSYLVVSSIQMGATIDYAIVITNRYLELKASMGHREAAVASLSQSFPTVLTSGTIMAVAGFLIGGISTDATIGSVGQALGRGTVTSIFLVMTVLPQMLVLGDLLIERTAITLNRDRKQRFNQGAMRLDGHVRGHVAGFVDGEFKGVIHGSVDALIESKYQELDRSQEEDET